MLAHFINTFNPKGRIADYGGTANIGSEIVKQMFSINDVSVEQKKINPDASLDINVFGASLKDIEPEYVLLDYNNGVDLLKPIKGKKFDFGISMDLLEHTKNPFLVAKNISNSLKPGALLFITVPFSWEVHDYPGDYFRFCPQGLEVLFPDMDAKKIEIIRDAAPEETITRSRLVAVFKKKEGLTKGKQYNTMNIDKRSYNETINKIT